MWDFLQTFYQQKGNFEFVLSENSISKVLFWSETYQNNHIISKYISSIHKDIFTQHAKSITSLFQMFDTQAIHIWYDHLNKRIKLYIGLYNTNFKSSLQIINKIKKILHIQDKYFLEPNFSKFDCIGIDFSSSWTDLKLYELLEKDVDKKYLNFADNSDIKEIGVLKNHGGRKKLFYRFWNHQDISVFQDDFELSLLDEFQREIKDFYVLKKTVKYYCLEWGKSEIYFI